jgi:hypothetical protein
MILVHALGGALAERLIAAQIERDHFLDEPAPASPGNLFEPVAHGDGVDGEWRARLRAHRFASRPPPRRTASSARSSPRDG